MSFARYAMTVLLCLALVTIVSAVSALRPEVKNCKPCDNHCPAIGECHNGITWDVCNCCEVCAKGFNQECGGPWDAYGKCGFGLTCLKDARDCPYLFHPRQTAADTGTNICDEYLFNAVGKCVKEEENLYPFKRNNMGNDIMVQELRRETAAQRERDALVGKRLMLKGVLRGVEY